MLFERCCWPRGEGSSLNRWSPSKCLMASTIVSRFCRDVLAKYNLRWRYRLSAPLLTCAPKSWVPTEQIQH
jgi:hypothetical protein